MKIKFQSFFGGRVGGALPPYRDHYASKVILITGSLDTCTAPNAVRCKCTPFAKIAQGYSTTGSIS